jgi:hypothetical protein
MLRTLRTTSTTATVSLTATVKPTLALDPTVRETTEVTPRYTPRKPS